MMEVVNKPINNGRSSATVPLFAAADARTDCQKTVICFGTVRGGTSAVAGTLVKLGVMMGDNLPNNYEDGIFTYSSKEKMIEAIRKRNEDFDLWGWKFPNAANYLDEIRDHIRNPYLIVVFRDYVATMKGHIRWHSREASRALCDVMLQQQRNTALLLRWTVPTLLVSYEKLVLNPQNGVCEIADFLDIEAPDDLDYFTSFLRPGAYKDLQTEV